MHRRSRTAIVTGVLLLAALVVSGCSGGASPEETTGDSDVSSGGGTFTYSYGTDGGQNYDPVTAANQYAGFFLLPAYDSLFEVDEGGELQPKLATGMSLSDDGLDLTLALREGVVFHDGTPFDGEAVKQNIARAKTAERSTLKQDLEAVESVEIVGNHEVVLHLSRPDAALPNMLADRAGMMVSTTALGNDDLDLKPVGAGPYRVVEHVPGSSITYELFEDYWDLKETMADELAVQIQLDPDSRFQALRSGQIDAAVLGQNQVLEVEDAGLTVLSTLAPAFPFMLYLNMTRNPALQDEKVREAISLALDRKGISDAILDGQCIPTGQIFTEGFWAAAEGVPVQEHADVEAAKQALAEASYSGDIGFSLAALGAAPMRPVAEAIADQLRQVGIAVELQIGEPAKVIGDFQSNKSVDAYTSMWVGPAEPSKTVSSLLLPGGLFNPGGYVDSDIVELAAQGIATTDQAERESIYQEISQRAVDTYFHIPICTAGFPQGVTEGVDGLTSTFAGLPDIRYAHTTD